MLAKKNPELKEAVSCVKKMSLLEELRYIRFHNNLAKVDKRMMLKAAHDDGHKEGLAKGKEEGLVKGLAKSSEGEKIEIARKMKNKGHPVDEIADITSLSNEVIEKL